MGESKVVREHLVRALEVDLIGPYGEDERLDRAPSRFYLTGFLVPREGRGDDEPEAADDEDRGEEEQAGEEGEADDVRPAGAGSKRRAFLPASIGLSVLLPPGEGGEIDVVLRCAEYRPYHPEGVKKTTRPFWQRVAHRPFEMRLPLDATDLPKEHRVEGLPGISIEGVLGVTSMPVQGARALSLFVVNRRDAGERGRRDEKYLFQVSLEVRFAAGFLARPALRRGSDLDDHIAALQYRHVRELAVGHGVSVEPPPASGPVTSVRTTWLPRTEVRRVVTSNVLDPDDAALDVTRSMDVLAKLTTADEVRAALGALPDAYGRWIARQEAALVPVEDRATLTRLVDRCEEARRRIAKGIDLLAASDEARRAFALANEAMAEQARRRLGLAAPSWHLFQLAFVLLCLPSIHDETAEDRETVELIFFPTGGGKTEAYLGVIAFTLLVRRMRGASRPDGGAGVAVILRYTLRLLTLDQLERAATLVCALERIRRERSEELGRARFAVGLWVGRSATSNTMAAVKAELGEYRKGSGASPCPLARCPWCGEDLGPNSLELDDVKKPTAVLVGCLTRTCDFSRAKNPGGIPVVFVDEQVYRDLPCFLVATVDKFAMVPWRAEGGMLFGKVAALRGEEAIPHGDKLPRGVRALPDGLRPPELIVQDELHLISGPLGTMVGLFETAVEHLARRTREDGRPVRPKILASTATVRRAAQQVQALMGRSVVRAFPPAGPEPGETFFATVDSASDGRLYLGVAAPGRTFRAALARVYQTLLAAGQHEWAATGEAADPYMTVVGYFNSLRELGAMRRVVEDEVPQRTMRSDRRAPLGVEPHPLFASRDVGQIVELTSRESSADIKDAKNRLKQAFSDERRRVDVVLASNMISVGVDIDRLGLMVVAGQPTTSAEYIQATSRVGRKAERPGLVVSCYNVRRVRDRSFYERFASYHASFYGWVEVSSVTPFSEPALERGLTAALFAMIRHGHPDLMPGRGAMLLARHLEVAAAAVKALRQRAAVQDGTDGEGLANRVEAGARDLVDSWIAETKKAEAANLTRGYSWFEDRKGLARPMLLRPGEEPLTEVEAKLRAPTSMRDTEPSVHLWLRYGLGRKQV